MTQNTTQTRTFALVDPRTLDGNPYEVAQNAVLQADGVNKLYLGALRDARVMARNAEMERQIVRTGKPDAVAFENGPIARRYDALIKEAEGAIKMLSMLARDAGFDPKAPLGKAS